MKYCTVTCYMTRGPEIESDNHTCAERKLLKQLYNECMKSGHKPHQFTSWLHRKYGELIVSRRTIFGDSISMPCVICRKFLQKHDVRWMAHDGCRWVHSTKTDDLPVSRPTRKQIETLGFCN